MPSLTLVTGSKHKLAAWQRLVPDNIELGSKDIDLVEIQSFNSQEIVAHKLHQAYDLVGGSVVVEDVSAGLDHLNGLPGPFIKFFEQQLGSGALYTLAGKEMPATVTCTIGYYDGQHELFVSGVVHGGVVTPRGSKDGFGFDFVFLPDGHSKTYGEMTFQEKDAISHRGLAVRKFLAELQRL